MTYRMESEASDNKIRVFVTRC